MSAIYVPGLVLSKEEKILYEYIFSMADFRKTGKVDGGVVKKMFGMTVPQVPFQQLGLIWELANESRLPGALNKPDFYRALRYISLAQAGREISKQSLSQSNSNRPKLPGIQGFNNNQIIAHYGKKPAQPAPIQQPQANAYAGAPGRHPQAQQVMQSPPQAQQQHQPAQPAQPAQAQPAQPQQQGQAAAAPASAEDAFWKISEPQRKIYGGYFKQADVDKDQFVSGREAMAFFKMSGLPAQVLSRVWALSDVDGDGRLDPTEFAIAVHLVFAVKKGASLPPALPRVLLRLKAPPASAQPAERKASESKSDPLDSFISPRSLKKQASAIALNSDETILPIRNEINAAQKKHDDFDEDLKLNTEKLQQSLAEVAELKSKLESLNKETEEIKIKIKDTQEELAHYDEQKIELSTQYNDLNETVTNQKESLSIIESKLADARHVYNLKSQQLVEQNNKMSTVKQSEKEMEAEIERMRREGQQLDAKIARGEKLVETSQGRLKDCQDRKAAQAMIVKEKQAQLDRILNQAGDSKDLIKRAKQELEQLKAESKSLRDQIVASGGSYTKARANLDAQIIEERREVDRLRAQLAGGSGAAPEGSGAADPGFDADPFAGGAGGDDDGSTVARNDAAAAAAGEELFSNDFPDMEFPTFDMGGDNPFGENPFADA
eukprot:CAMPEP_0114513140 /NCGR_PEP_ID=MMETSP0109-20121206/15390_1 /TAXON_ID=29199 /ORGANISM="Chlorarachnion reptans, Strain CCCM449" /LENGTH=663 /DNA_ID=CAMNT_0001692951 /DNA_START=98 /DNA_END=2085 /DNA_ORIENTATION=-